MYICKVDLKTCVQWTVGFPLATETSENLQAVLSSSQKESAAHAAAKPDPSTAHATRALSRCGRINIEIALRRRFLRLQSHCRMHLSARQASANGRPVSECASVTWISGPMRIESPRLGKFLQVGSPAAPHLRRTGNTAEWKTIACRAGQGCCRGARRGKNCRVGRAGGL